MKILVTGHTGTLGSHLVPMLLELGHEVIGYSRCELKQANYLNHTRFTQYLGDVRDQDRLVEASRGVSVIFHLAALKRVEMLELNPEEGLATNVQGTKNVLHAQRINHIERVILSATDKGVHPINTYGVTKALAERLVLRNPNNVVCRYGNVIASRGSVIPMFIKTLKERNSFDITDKRMTRFFIRPQKAAEFVLNSMLGPGGLRIPEMRATQIIKLGFLISEILNLPIPKVFEVGMRPGEKIHEVLRLEEEGGRLESSDQRLWFTAKELLELIKPMIEEINQ